MVQKRYDIEFEQYWLVNKRDILADDSEYKRIMDSIRINSKWEWLIWTIPIAGGILASNYVKFEREILNWLTISVIVIICFVLCAWVQSLMMKAGSVTETEKRVKEETYLKWKAGIKK